MKEITLTREQFEEFRELQIRPRFDWPATFSANRRGDVWPYKTRGHTPKGERIPLRGLYPVLDKIVAAYVVERKKVGRFFINDEGAHRADTNEQFVRFKFVD
jgi:hypothetical protein